MNKNLLEKLYLVEKLSTMEISKKLKCSVHKVNYWIEKYNIPKRTMSEAIYQKNNPNGDPFSFNEPKKSEDIFLFGLGLGLFWGEGTKKGKHALRLSNSDPILIKKYLDFLVKIYNIDKNRLRFQLQTYDDLDIKKLILFWTRQLSIKKSQFYKSTILVRRGNGTYREKMKYGVIIVNFNNMKLKSIVCSHIANIASM
jgi:hypothetical protein